MDKIENPKKKKQLYLQYMRKVKKEFMRTVQELLQDEYSAEVITDDDSIYISLGYGLDFKLKVTCTKNKKQGELLT